MFNPWVGKIPWRSAWQPTSVLLAGESHEQRSLVNYSPWGCKELDTTERLSLHSTKCKHMESKPTLKVKMLVTQSCPTLHNPMDCSLPDSSLHGILQVRILEWVAMPSSRGSSRPRDGTDEVPSFFYFSWCLSQDH